MLAELKTKRLNVILIKNFELKKIFDSDDEDDDQDKKNQAKKNVGYTKKRQDSD